MVDFRAMASRDECIGWASIRVCLNMRQGTIALWRRHLFQESLLNVLSTSCRILIESISAVISTI